MWLAFSLVISGLCSVKDNVLKKCCKIWNIKSNRMYILYTCIDF